MEITTILILLLSGLTVGFLNTLAGGATVISMSIFMALGLPIIEAGGTNRIAVMMQNAVSTFVFRRQRLIDMKQALKLSVPIILGTILGAQFTMLTSNGLFALLFSGGLIFLGTMMLFRPSDWIKQTDGVIGKTTPLLWILLFLSGIYSGSVYVGVGYMFIAIFVIGYGYDLVRANALKGFMALILTPASLILYIMHSQVNYSFGLVHGIGNIIGAYIGSKYATKIGVNTLRKVLLAMILISLIDLVRKPFFIEFVKGLFS